MKTKTETLTGIALNFAVAKSKGGTDFSHDTIGTYWIKIDGKDRALSKGWAQSFTPSTDWSVGGPIIDDEKICLWSWGGEYEACYDGLPKLHVCMGPTALIAAMRCYASSKLGDEVEIPDELLRHSNH